MCHGTQRTAVHYARGSSSTVVSQVCEKDDILHFLQSDQVMLTQKELQAGRQKSTMSFKAMEKSGVGETVAILKDMRTRNDHTVFVVLLTCWKCKACLDKHSFPYVSSTFIELLKTFIKILFWGLFNWNSVPIQMQLDPPCV